MSIDWRLNPKARKAFEIENKKWPNKFVEIPVERWCMDVRELPIKVLRHRKYVVQVHVEKGYTRLSIHKTTILKSGQWEDGLQWDELQKIKREIGYGDKWAVELFPPDEQTVNVANMRHLWLIDEPVFGWKDIKRSRR